ncbi:MAG: hypothetical protein FD189_1871 [Elusimicrobia bacterium]|nr:MAG: hypothetical protein FD154_2048 [Elusimicrobiota bacterium]KAF0154493.1 MAG: hypothetical protein FD189_1871 [Elusimicrobiota bacterium]
MVKINLIPQEYIDRLNRKVVIAKAVLAGVAVAAVLVMVSGWHFTRVKRMEIRLAEREAEMAVLKTDVERVKAIEAEIAEVQRYLEAINRISRNRFIYTRFMQDVTSDLPASMWFNGMNTTLKDTTLSLTISLMSRSPYDLAYWINHLERDPRYAEVTLGAVSIAEVEGAHTYSAPINFKYMYK